MDFQPLKFIEEKITVYYDKAPMFEKTPTCPSKFTWRDRDYIIVELLGEWRDYERRGRYKRNMQPQHAVVASQRGSWGVGLFFFRVRVETAQIFELYFDRAPKSSDQRKGEWYLYRELAVSL
jgi:hypothetical protein